MREDELEKRMQTLNGVNASHLVLLLYCSKQGGHLRQLSICKSIEEIDHLKSELS